MSLKVAQNHSDMVLNCLVGFCVCFGGFEYDNQFKNPPFQVKNPHKSSCFFMVDQRTAVNRPGPPDKTGIL